MTLYQIEEALLDCIDPETGEINEEQYDALTLAREEKIENTALLVKNLTAEITALKAERETFDKRIKAAEKSVDAAKKRLSDALDGEKFETTRCRISFRSSNSLVVEDIKAIPQQYISLEPKADKAAIKAAIQAGETIEGAHIETKQNIQIK